MEDRESDLVKRLASGERQAMAEYLNFKRPELLGVILGKMGPALRSRVEAEDIYQEVCQSALSSFAEVRFNEGGVFGWLCELASRRIVDVDRKHSAQKRAAHREVGIHGSPEQTQAGLANLLVASITSPSQAFSRQQREFKLIAALDQLPAEQKLVLQLRYAEGKRSKEIAEQIGKSDGATRVLITRALHKLRSILEETG